ncbi:putative transmembrane protein [Methylobacter tundripaludum SV96]|uniref:Putative transmembrane protein n=2 Tax=Methylobacter tundripaludum TaxID=173365 RepID=G3IS97_METTV|nr:putative transmembrane protein [Methylobacter tundripaludum SV96]
MLLAVMALAIAGLSLMAFRLSHEKDPGLTTEVALLLTLLLGGLAMREPALASGVAVLLALLLTARTVLHRFVSTILSEAELNDALILAAAALVLLPLAPDQYLGPFNALNPRTIWKIVILIMSISATGYISLRVMGPRIGLPITGLASGFVSSAATISSMGARAAKESRRLSD